jgi:hypothetical protein
MSDSKDYIPTSKRYKPKKDRRQRKKCEHCEQGHLYWKRTYKGWRLHTIDDVLHSCITHEDGTPVDD